MKQCENILATNFQILFLLEHFDNNKNGITRHWVSRTTPSFEGKYMYVYTHQLRTDGKHQLRTDGEKPSLKLIILIFFRTTEIISTELTILEWSGFKLIHICSMFFAVSTHIGTSPFSVKDCKIRPILCPHGHLAVWLVPWRATPTCTGIRV